MNNRGYMTRKRTNEGERERDWKGLEGGIMKIIWKLWGKTRAEEAQESLTCESTQGCRAHFNPGSRSHPRNPDSKL